MATKITTEEERRALVERVQRGESINAVAKEAQTTPHAVRVWRSKLERGLSPMQGIDGRKIYTLEFKRAAVDRLLRGEHYKKVAEDLGVHPSTMVNWRAKFAALKEKKKTVGGGIGKRGPDKTPRRTKPKLLHTPTVVPAPSTPPARLVEYSNAQRNIHQAVGLLRSVRKKFNTDDPVHLITALVLATLEGKM